jgi:hypothetical protein
MSGIVFVLNASLPFSPSFVAGALASDDEGRVCILSGATPVRPSPALSAAQNAGEMYLLQTGKRRKRNTSPLKPVCLRDILHRVYFYFHRTGTRRGL